MLLEPQIPSQDKKTILSLENADKWPELVTQVLLNLLSSLKVITISNQNKSSDTSIFDEQSIQGLDSML